MGDRYFPGTAMGGRLYLDGSEAPAYCGETVVDMLVTRIGHRKARTEAELLGVLRESDRCLPAIRMWISEELHGVAQKLREESRAATRSIRQKPDR